MSKLPDLPADWFCENQADLLALITQMQADARQEGGDGADADADPDRV